VTPRLIRRIRLTAGMSARRFAARYGMTHGAVSLWESGRRRPSRPIVSLYTLIAEVGHLRDPTTWAETWAAVERLHRNHPGAAKNRRTREKS
jgi:transcriptional regulator with XRE-family HTH domain